MPELSRVEKQKIISGRKAVDAYREAHRQLHSKPWHKGIPEEHTPLLNTMLDALKKQGFNTIQEFFDANDELNKQVFRECYRLEGYCTHDCHGRAGGCREDWYQERMKETQNETLEPIGTMEEAYRAYGLHRTKKHTPVRCNYRIIEVTKPDIDWHWK